MASAPCSPLRRMRRLMDSLPEEPPPCRRELASGPLWRRVFVELLGSLLFTVLTASLQQQQQQRRQPDGAAPLQCSVAMGASAAALAHCLSGDLNPAVTLSRLVGRRLSVVRALLCVAAQCSGACLGAAALYGLAPRDHRQQPAQQLAQGLHASQAFGVEFLGTVLVALSALAAADRDASGPLGVAYAAAALFAYRFTGAGLNPARSLGPALITNTWSHHWVYWAGPMLGGLMAGFTHEYTRGSRLGGRELTLRPSPSASQPARTNHVKRDLSGLSNDTELTLSSNNDCRV